MQTQEGAALVSFRNVQKTYDGETLNIKDLNLDVMASSACHSSSSQSPQRCRDSTTTWCARRRASARIR